MTDDSICGRRIGAEEEGISDRGIQIEKTEVGAGIGEGGEIGGGGQLAWWRIGFRDLLVAHGAVVVASLRSLLVLVFFPIFLFHELGVSVTMLLMLTRRRKEGRGHAPVADRVRLGWRLLLL